MERKLALLIVAVVVLPVVGCTKSGPSSGGVTTTSPETTAVESTQETAATEKPAATTDSAVVPAAATVETPVQPSGEIGAPAPEWANLTGTDDQSHSLADLAEAKAVVVVFTCNTCPVAVAYEDRLIQLANDYKDQGVALVAINVNNDEGNKLPAMKDRATEKGFTFTYAYDPTQQIARDYGATVTPHAFLLDGQRRIVYRGGIDDNQDSSAVTEQYLRAAIEATLAGQQPKVTDIKPVGCGIKYE